MHLLCLGGSTAGLYSSLLMTRHNLASQITVVERNRPFDTFGWDAVLSNLQAANPASARLLDNAFNHWDDVEIHFQR